MCDSMGTARATNSMDVNRCRNLFYPFSIYPTSDDVFSVISVSVPSVRILLYKKKNYLGYHVIICYSGGGDGCWGRSSCGSKLRRAWTRCFYFPIGGSFIEMGISLFTDTIVLFKSWGGLG